MGYTIDYFVAALRCPVCGHISAADSSTNMQTHIRDNPELAYLGVGHPLEIPTNSMRERGYLTVQLPKPGEAVRILETWECPSCGQTFNWAEIIVDEGVIKSISAVPLNSETLARIHFISDEIVGVAVVLTGEPYDKLLREDVVKIISERLEKTKEGKVDGTTPSSQLP